MQVDKIKRFDIQRLPLHENIHHLPNKHPFHTCAVCNRFHGTCCLRCRVFHAGIRHRFHGMMQQTIPCQNRHILAKNLMVRQSPPAVIIVIHRRQVIMNQRIGMNHFQGARKGKCILLFAADCLACRQNHHRAQTLAPCQKAVAHCFKNHRRKVLLFGYCLLQRLFNIGTAFLHFLLQIHHSSTSA